MTARAPHLTTFLREHLPRERRASPHTCEAYAYSFQPVLCFAASRLRTTPSRIEIEQLDPPLLLAFLEHIEREPATRRAPATPVLLPSKPSSASSSTGSLPVWIRRAGFGRFR